MEKCLRRNSSRSRRAAPPNPRPAATMPRRLTRVAVVSTRRHLVNRPARFRCAGVARSTTGVDHAPGAARDGDARPAQSLRATTSAAAASNSASTTTSPVYSGTACPRLRSASRMR